MTGTVSGSASPPTAGSGRVVKVRLPQLPSPEALLARTANVYCVPGSKPVTVADTAVLVVPFTSAGVAVALRPSTPGEK